MYNDDDDEDEYQWKVSAFMHVLSSFWTLWIHFFPFLVFCFSFHSEHYHWLNKIPIGGNIAQLFLDRTLDTSHLVILMKRKKKFEWTICKCPILLIVNSLGISMFSVYGQCEFIEFSSSQFIDSNERMHFRMTKKSWKFLSALMKMCHIKECVQTNLSSIDRVWKRPEKLL